MREHKFYWTPFATSLCAMLVLAACVSLPTSTGLNTGGSREGIVDTPITSAQVDEQSVRLSGGDVASEAAPSSDTPLVQEATDRNAESGQQVALFAIEPLISPCCPLPTPDKALAAAQNTPGVVAAELIDDTTVRVRFNPAQIDSMAIASAINQASFLVTVIEESAETMKTSAIAEKKESN